MFARKKIAVLLVALLLLTVAVLPGRVLADEHADITLTEDEPFIATYGWIAANRGLVQAYLNADIVSATLSREGTVIEHVDDATFSQYWGPIVPFDLTLLGLECPDPNGAAAFVTYNFGTLEPGTYTLTGNVEMEHAIHDGLHVCGDRPAGPPLFFNGTTGTLTIEVTPAES